MKTFNYSSSQLYNPVLKALHAYNGKATNSQIEEYIRELLDLSDEEMYDIHRNNETKLNYRLRWSRNYLKRYGLIDNKERGIWTLTQKGLEEQVVDPKEVNQVVKKLNIPSWHDTFYILTQLLIDLYSMNQDKSSQILYKLLLNSDSFAQISSTTHIFSDNRKLEEVNPIDIFASFNNERLSKSMRISLINIYTKILVNYLRNNAHVKNYNPSININSSHYDRFYSNINFDGCPTLITNEMIFTKNSKKIWILFSDIIENNQKASINFEEINNWISIEFDFFTIFLFWINPKNFLPLNKQVKSLLKKYSKLTTQIETYVNYLKLLPGSDTNLYIKLALLAENKEDDYEEEHGEKHILSEYLNISTENNSSKLNTSLKIIAIKLLHEHEDNKYSKTLKLNELYCFDKAYSFEGNNVVYDANIDTSFYNQENLNININAIAGKNGTGKSTLLELVFMIINNIAFKKLHSKDKETRFKYVEKLFLEFYFESIFLHKVIISDKQIIIEKYKSEEDANNKTQYLKPQKVDISNFNLEELFYTIAVNYSQHSLNCLYLGDWIESLFHKNDAYQTPIVIEPFRDRGNIDINKQENLVKQRLLSNLLIPESNNDKDYSFRQLSEYYRADKLSLSINKTKFNYIYKNNGKEILFSEFTIGKVILAEFYNQLDLEIKQEVILKLNNDEYNTAQLYILKKLVTIPLNYKHYNKYFDERKGEFNFSDHYFELLKKDKSHITYKLFQAINYLKNESIQYKNGQIIAISKCSENITELSDSPLSFQEYLPPSFFNIDIILDNDSNFKFLSSGEKQKIYSINSILYHINNINSVSKKLKRYEHIYVVLDEIELYFHPELQRMFLNDLLKSIKKVNTNFIQSININFITHSPFILSDIPDLKILFLEKEKSNDIKSKTISSTKDIKTFGANIHELLINGFFMESSIGDFSLIKIREIVDFHYKVMNTNQDMNELIESYDLKKNEFYFVQNNIGEDYIRNILMNHIEDIEEKLHHNEFKEKQIKLLEEQISNLRTNHD